MAVDSHSLSSTLSPVSLLPASMMLPWWHGSFPLRHIPAFVRGVAPRKPCNCNDTSSDSVCHTSSPHATSFALEQLSSLMLRWWSPP